MRLLWVLPLLALLDTESYRLRQLHLVLNREAGDLIRGTGGLRKMRWKGSGRGKRGGVRVIYYWSPQPDIVLLLLIYGKKKQDELTADQGKALKTWVEEEFNG